MFLVDTSPSMGKVRTVELNGEERTIQMTNLQWALQFVKLKIQEMVRTLAVPFNQSPTPERRYSTAARPINVVSSSSGVKVSNKWPTLFCLTQVREETNNIINEKNGGYDNVAEYIPVGQPNAATLSKIDALEPSEISGDRMCLHKSWSTLIPDPCCPAIDALIVGIETQAEYLASKKTWTRKVVIITDGESPIEIEDWEATVRKMDALDVNLTIVFVSPLSLGKRLSSSAVVLTLMMKSSLMFSLINHISRYLPSSAFQVILSTYIQRVNEKFYHTLTSEMKAGVIGTCALALRETTRPDIKQTKSTLMGTVLRLGDVDTKSDEALEIIIKTSKCTALSRPKGWKKFAVRERLDDEDEEMSHAENEEDERKVTYAQLRMRTEYLVDRSGGNEEDKDGDVKMEDDDELLDEGDESEREKREKEKAEQLEKVEKEQLIRGFKYGTTYAPCPDGQFPRLPTKKGIDICGFFPAKNVGTFFMPRNFLPSRFHLSSVASLASEKFSTSGPTHPPHSSR
jgi:ATP-dependent DNA helicase 2 subunit 2